ncbi:MAG: hypothetical protein GY925_13200 [Actinomycetia bacterium]|nr:hypothetical protein [Actinomycetes bacterium]
MLGTPPMPWQQYLLDVAYEVCADGRQAYREVVVTVPRQQGKTTVVLSVEIDAVVNMAPALVIYTAQTGTAARKKLLRDHEPAIRGSQIGVLWTKTVQARGEEAIEFANGSEIALSANTESSGHGGVISKAVLDESFRDVDDRREQALLPGMLTIPDAQLWVVSTQGNDASHYLNRKCDLGRQAVLDDSGHGICYVEFAADPDADPFDPATWWSCMPALGHTIDEPAVSHMAQSMSPDDFRRAGLNIRNSEESDRPISSARWAAVQDKSTAPAGGLVLGVEAAIDQSATSLVVADDRGHVEMVDYRKGTSWGPDRIRDLWSAHGCRVVLDPKGPAQRFVQPLERLGVPFERLSSPLVAAAALTFVDLVCAGQVWVRPHHAFDAAVEVACRRWSGDQWYWARRLEVDVGPLVAASLAVLMAGEPAPSAPPDRGPVELVVL